MISSERIPDKDLKIEWCRPSSNLCDESCFVRLTHIPTGKMEICDDYIGGQVARHKNFNIAYQALLKAINQEE